MAVHRRSLHRSDVRIYGLAVAVGIGAALVAGSPVAAAEPSADPGSESTSTSSQASETSTDTTKPEVEKPSEPDAEKPTAPTEVDEDPDDDKPAVDDSKKRRDSTKPQSRSAGSAPKQSEREERADRSDRRVADKSAIQASVTSDTAADEAQAVTTAAATTASVTVAVQPEEPNEPDVLPAAPANDPAEVVTTALTTVVSAVLDPFAGDAPTAPPAESPLSWTVLAAARREFLGQTPTVNESTNPVATDSVAALVATEAAPAIPEPPVAVVRTAPLGFLQQIPVLGPAFVTPIVALLHQIPVVGDVIHHFVGYPVQWGQPAGAPAPRDVYITSFDGTQINVHFMPAVGLAPGKQAPTVLVGSGLGLTGATNLDGTLLDGVLVDTFGLVGVGPLRHAGYNVVTWDPRGEYFSGGVLQIDHPEFEGRDVQAIISWLATQPEVLLDDEATFDPRIGMVGVSYGGGIQLVTAAMDKRVDAIVPTIAWHGLDTSLYKATAPKTSWSVLLTAVLAATVARFNPQVVGAVITGALTGQLPQEYVDFLEARSPGRLVDNITVPTLLIQGTVDTLFSLQEADATALALIANGVPTKVVWFCGGHGVCMNNLVDFRDGQVIQQQTLAWLDRYVKGNVLTPTGPQFQWVDQSGQWYSSDSYQVTPGSPVVASTADGGVLPLLPVIGGSGLPLIPLASKAINAVNLTTPKADTTAYIVGAPKLTFTYSGNGYSRHIYAQLVDDSTGWVLGQQVTPIPVTLDGQTHTVTVDLEPVAHTLKPGQTVTLQLVAEAGTYQEFVPTLGQLAVGSMTVSSMQLTLPSVDAATVSTTSTQAVAAA